MGPVPRKSSSKPSSRPIFSPEPSNSLNSSKKVRWTEDEDEQLEEANEKLGSDWEKISSFFHGRSPIACRQRIQRLVVRDRVKKGANDDTPRASLSAGAANPKNPWGSKFLNQSKDVIGYDLTVSRLLTETPARKPLKERSGRITATTSITSSPSSQLVRRKREVRPPENFKADFSSVWDRKAKGQDSMKASRASSTNGEGKTSEKKIKNWTKDEDEFLYNAFEEVRVNEELSGDCIIYSTITSNLPLFASLLVSPLIARCSTKAIFTRLALLWVAPGLHAMLAMGAFTLSFLLKVKRKRRGPRRRIIFSRNLLRNTASTTGGKYPPL